MKIEATLLEGRDAAERFVANIGGDPDASMCFRFVHDSDRGKPARNLRERSLKCGLRLFRHRAKATVFS